MKQSCLLGIASTGMRKASLSDLLRPSTLKGQPTEPFQSSENYAPTWRKLGISPKRVAPDTSFHFFKHAQGRGLPADLRRFARRQRLSCGRSHGSTCDQQDKPKSKVFTAYKCACDWIGNSASVAKRHYLQVTKEQRIRAVSDGAVANRQEPIGGVRSTGRSKKAKHDISD